MRVYDKERCICDLIRDKKDMDMQLYTQAVNEYFKAGSSMRKILKYGKKLRVEELHIILFESILERLSLSKYKDNFILKGGLLISL